ncbi:hypothetical protein ZP9_00015 [Shewanella phage ZP9]|nr:hypothetical protein ZP9_00015 [Shewanella phage ZP9]
MNIVARVNGVEVAKVSGTLEDISLRRNAIMSEAIRIRNSVDLGEIDEVICPVKNHFCNGVYIREIQMPKDTFIISKIHKTEYFNEVVSGICKVVTAETGEVKTYSAGDIFVSKAGEQKVGYCVTDVIWRTVHVNESNSQDLEEIESRLIASSYESLENDQLIQECKRILL